MNLSSTEKGRRRADDAYLQGAKFFSEHKYDAAQRSFQQATLLDPDNTRYLLALLCARQAQIRAIAHDSLKATSMGNDTIARDLLKKAAALDPGDPFVLEHLSIGNLNSHAGSFQIIKKPVGLQKPIELLPSTERVSLHLSGNLGTLITQVYKAFGIQVTLDPSVISGPMLTFDMDEACFAEAGRALSKMGGVFAVALEPRHALVARNTEELRDLLFPLVEETVFLPGQTPDQLQEFANMARNLFGIKQVSISTGVASIVLRGEEPMVSAVSDLYREIIQNEQDVLFDVNLYEIDQTKARNIGFESPTSATATDVSSAALSLINSNQTLLSESISSGVLKLTGNTYQQELEEVEYLVAAGVSGSSTFTSILGTLGTYDGIPIEGISLGSTSFNLSLTSTSTHTFDSMQLRAHDGQAATFRVGERYPILTALTSGSTSTSTLVSELEAAGVSSSVISQYTSSTTTTTTVPQIQFEDLGITLAITPHILRDGEVNMALDLKIEALGGTGVDNIPILDNRVLKSTVTVANGEPTMLTTLLSTNETKVLDGLPELSDVPGYATTDKSTDGTRYQLLITVTPRILSKPSSAVD